ncbi:hypothetical protein AB833_04505 [Chromatiales bacterium (ex Bugula neritina AB1)]|nr:hypothetical protein AB833_04505 [Chromatiales bacterium (ex Bugula neritina AB1)]
MIAEELINNLNGQRQVGYAQTGDPELGLLRYLPGTWQNSDRFADRGWNMIALPFSDTSVAIGDPRDYRVLANQYNETLLLKEADKGVPKRGVIRDIDANLEQTIIALDYEQIIRRSCSADKPKSGKAKEREQVAIHHEPGLWLHILDHHQSGVNIARLGTVSHGNSLLALGTAEEFGENPDIVIPETNLFPFSTATQVPLDQDPLDRYLEPCSGFVASDNTFFPDELELRNLHGLLQSSTPGNIKGGVKYSVSTAVSTGDIVNIPFIVDQAVAVQMDATFWIYELEETDVHNQAVMVMQYLQVVMLDFSDRFNGNGKIRWPHVSLNTLVRTSSSASERQEVMRSTIQSKV